MLKKLVVLIVLASVMGLQTACSTFVSGKEEIVVLTSEGDASIYANGDLVGKGKARFAARKDKDLSIMVKKTGFRTETRHISSTIGAWGIVDVIGACFWLVPIIGLAFPGSRQLEESSISIPLEAI